MHEVERDSGRHLQAGLSALNGPDGCHVAASGPGVDGDGTPDLVRHDQLVVIGVERQAGRSTEAGGGAGDRAERGEIAARCSRVDGHRAAFVVGDEELLAVHRQGRRRRRGEPEAIGHRELHGVGAGTEREDLGGAEDRRGPVRAASPAISH